MKFNCYTRLELNFMGTKNVVGTNKLFFVVKNCLNLPAIELKVRRCNFHERR